MIKTVSAVTAAAVFVAFTSVFAQAPALETAPAPAPEATVPASTPVPEATAPAPASTPYSTGCENAAPDAGSGQVGATFDTGGTLDIEHAVKEGDRRFESLSIVAMLQAQLHEKRALLVGAIDVIAQHQPLPAAVGESRQIANELRRERPAVARNLV